MNIDPGKKVFRLFLTSPDNAERAARVPRAPRTVPVDRSGNCSPAVNLQCGRCSTVTRTRNSAGRVRLILSDPVNLRDDRRKKIALGPERLVFPKVFGMAAGRAARSESSNFSEIVKEELRGEAGEQILRQVRGIVKREIGTYASRHGLKKTIE